MQLIILIVSFTGKREKTNNQQKTYPHQNPSRIKALQIQAELDFLKYSIFVTTFANYPPSVHQCHLRRNLSRNIWVFSILTLTVESTVWISMRITGFCSHHATLRHQLLALNTIMFDLPTLLVVAGVTPHNNQQSVE